MTISENDTRAYHLGDRASLGWEAKVKFPELVKMMVDADLARLAPPGVA